MSYEDSERQVSFYLYKIKKLRDIKGIEYIIPANISYSLAELNEINDWSYHKVIQETNNNFFLEGINIKGYKRRILKRFLELGSKITIKGEYSLAHRGFIREIEKDEELDFL